MTKVVSHAALILIGGYIFVAFGNLVLQSLRDKQARDELLSSPHLRNPTRFHKLAFAALAALLLAFAVMLIARGVSDLGS